MMKGEDSEEVEIDLRDSDDPDGFDDRDTETLWKAPLPLEEEENIHTSTLVEISDTKPLLNVRDPRGINDCLKTSFEDVIAEPVAVRSADRVWIWSHALFEVSRVWIYRIVTVLLAVPVSIISGLLLALLSCLHIWMVHPCIQCMLVGTRWLQSLWDVVLEIIVRPFFTSAGRAAEASASIWPRNDTQFFSQVESIRSGWICSIGVSHPGSHEVLLFHRCSPDLPFKT